MLTKLNRVTFTEQAVQSPLAYIAAEGLQPGQALPSEARLASELGVSRPIIREALKALQGKGIIMILNGKGAVIKPLDAGALQTFFQRAVQVDKGAILELMEVRRGIEIESALLAAERCTVTDKHELREIITKMRQHLNEMDMYIELDAIFHLTIAQAAHNAILYHLVQSLHGSAQQAIREGLLQRHTQEDRNRVQEIHEQLVEYIVAGDTQASGHAMAPHFDEAITVPVKTPEVSLGIDAPKP